MDLPSELNVKGTLNYWFKDCKLTIRSFLLPWQYFLMVLCSHQKHLIKSIIS